MKTEGLLAPESAAEARHSYADLAGAARTVTRETAKAMGFDREEYAERVTDNVRSTARDALFASLLEVRVGDRDEFETWRADFDGDCRVMGSDDVPNVAWHVVPFGAEGPPDRAAGDSGGRSPPGSRTESGGEDVTPVAVAATFQDEPAAAVATLRRTVFGRVYRDVIHADPVKTGAHSAVPPEEDEDGDEGEGGDEDAAGEDGDSDAESEDETEAAPDAEGDEQ